MVLVWHQAGAYEINGQKPGSTTAMTPFAVGTSIPVAFLQCAATRGVSHTTDSACSEGLGADARTHACPFGDQTWALDTVRVYEHRTRAPI